MATFTGFVLLVLMSVGAEKLSIDLYPGYGWDHLRFIDMLPIFSVRNSNDSSIMQQCISQIPIRKSEIDVNSDIIDIYNSSTTSYANEFTINGEVDSITFGVSGSYSKSYQEVKRQQGLDNTVTIRNEIRYTLADVSLLRSCPLDLQFKSEIINIANYIKTEQQILATYASQVFVLRYGTHYTSRLRIGGHIVEENFVKSKDLYVNELTKKTTQWSAKLSFLLKFNLAIGYGVQSSASIADVKKYEEQVTNRRIIADGGQPFLLGMSLQEWQSTIEKSPIILERTFENIAMAIDPKQINEVEEFYVYKAIEQINRAINTYIKTNLIYGCMDRNSPSFNWLANVDGESCVQNTSSMQFGGFVRTCEIKWITNYDSKYSLNESCNAYKLVNFYTNTEDCPLGFTRNPVHTSARIQPIERIETYGCGFFWLSSCNRSKPVGTATTTLKLYSCTKNSATSPQFTFGGSYTSNKINLITNERSCPTGFTSYQTINGILVCFTQQVINFPNLLKFGGIFSCQTNYSVTGTDACLGGFSPYVMGVLDGDCMLYICLQLRGQDIKKLPSISLPPYFDLLDQLKLSAPLNNSNINVTNNAGKSISTLRMNPIIIDERFNLAIKTCTSWIVLSIILLSGYAISTAA